MRPRDGVVEIRALYFGFATPARRRRGGRSLQKIIEVHPEQAQRTDDRQDPAGGMESAVGRPEDQGTDDTAHERAADAERYRHPESQGHRARVEEARQRADDEADDDDADDVENSHERVLLCFRVRFLRRGSAV